MEQGPKIDLRLLLIERSRTSQYLVYWVTIINYGPVSCLKYYLMEKFTNLWCLISRKTSKYLISQTELRIIC